MDWEVKIKISNVGPEQFVSAAVFDLEQFFDGSDDEVVIPLRVLGVGQTYFGGEDGLLLQSDLFVGNLIVLRFLFFQLLGCEAGDGLELCVFVLEEQFLFLQLADFRSEGFCLFLVK